MKTTIDLSDAILLRAKAVARAEKVTLRSLTEEGLARILAERESRPKISISPVTFKGNGLAPGLEQADWTKLRALAYGLAES